MTRARTHYSSKEGGGIFQTDVRSGTTKDDGLITCLIGGGGERTRGGTRASRSASWCFYRARPSCPEQRCCNTQLANLFRTWPNLRKYVNGPPPVHEQLRKLASQAGHAGQNGDFPGLFPNYPDIDLTSCLGRLLRVNCYSTPAMKARERVQSPGAADGDFHTVWVDVGDASAANRLIGAQSAQNASACRVAEVADPGDKRDPRTGPCGLLPLCNRACPCDSH